MDILDDIKGLALFLGFDPEAEGKDTSGVCFQGTRVPDRQWDERKLLLIDQERMAQGWTWKVFDTVHQRGGIFEFYHVLNHRIKFVRYGIWYMTPLMSTIGLCVLLVIKIVISLL